MPDRVSQLSFGFTDELQNLGDVERWAATRTIPYITGVDEAGRGPLAGPVVAAAVCFAPDIRIERLDDSKRLSATLREALFPEIRKQALGWGVAYGSPALIHEKNILQATRICMRRAFRLAQTRGAGDGLVVIDGNQRIDIEQQQWALVGGDRLSVAVAAASVLAKVLRDRWMTVAAKRWPQYGFERHKGYGTKAHLLAIAEHGPCPIHRLDFRGVREHVKNSNE